mmetsp:Transcript_7446/g.21176  ORF Transcript_7446/g.21176 Transcript_7446/m.21176 type:complete len:154 (+) Transcript_7446:78-539(+)
MGLRTWAAVAAGALAGHLPAFLLQAQVPGMQAMWGWSDNSAKCAYRGEGSCTEAEVPAGGFCTVKCPSGAPSTGSIPCPKSTGEQGSTGDAGWWDACDRGFGACKGQLQIGAGVACVDASTTTAAAKAPSSSAAHTALPSAVAALSCLALAAK